MKRISLVLVSMVLLLSVVTQGEVLPTVYVRASSFYADYRLPRYAVDGSGVGGASGELHDLNPDQTMWRTNSSELISDAWFECDLGQICNLSLMRLHNYNDKGTDLDLTDLGVKHFVLLLSNDGVTYTAFGGTRTAMKAPDRNDEPGAIQNNNCLTIFDLSGAVGRFIKIDIIDRYRTEGTNDGVGFSEVGFEGTYTGLGGNIPVEDITATSDDTDLRYYSYDPQNLVNGSGFVPDDYGAHYYTDGSKGPNGWIGFMSDGDAIVTAAFNEPKDLVGVRIWNLDSWFIQGNSAAKDFQLLVSRDGVTFTPAVTDQLNPYVNSTIYNYSLPFAMNAADVVAVQMVITSTQIAGGSTSGLNEIQFIEADTNLSFYNLVDFAGLAGSWRCSDGDANYDDLWDIVDNDVIDMGDLVVFLESWLGGF